MRPAQELQSDSDTGEPDLRARRHLATRLAELRARNDVLAEQIATVEADMATPYGDSIWQLILRDREQELVTQRARVAALLDSVLADTSKPPTLRALHGQELQQQMDAFTQRIAAVRADEDRAASITWSDREQVLAEHKARLVAELQEVTTSMADVEAVLGS